MTIQREGGFECFDSYAVSFERYGEAAPFLLGAAGVVHGDAAPPAWLQAFTITEADPHVRWGDCKRLVGETRVNEMDLFAVPGGALVCEGTALPVELLWGTRRAILQDIQRTTGATVNLGAGEVPESGDPEWFASAKRIPAGTTHEFLSLQEGWDKAMELDAGLRLYVLQHPEAQLHSSFADAWGYLSTDMGEVYYYADRHIGLALPGSAEGYEVILQKRRVADNLTDVAVYRVLSSAGKVFDEPAPRLEGHQLRLDVGSQRAEQYFDASLFVSRITPDETGYIYQYFLSVPEEVTFADAMYDSNTGRLLIARGPASMMMTVLPPWMIHAT